VRALPRVTVLGTGYLGTAHAACLAGLGFDVNAKGRSDVPAEDPWQTALHVAAMDGRLELARSLLRLGADPGLRSAMGERALALDVSQDIEGIDVGRAPTPYDRAEQLAAEAYGAGRTWFLTNGASQGNHALCLALATPGRHVLVQRNSHASVIDIANPGTIVPSRTIGVSRTAPAASAAACGATITGVAPAIP